MADIRINSLPTTASASSSDDFLALDGATNGTRKLNAYSPTFGGNLTVSGTGTFNGSSVAFANSAAGSGPNIKFENLGGSTQLSETASSSFYHKAYSHNFLSLAGTSLMALSNTGNLTVSGTGTSSVAGSLGIGTTSPGTLLDAVGTSSTGLVRVTDYSNGDAGQFIARGSRGTPSAPTAQNSSDSTGLLRMYGYDGSSFIENARIYAQTAGTIATNRVGGVLSFWTHPDSTSAIAEAMRITQAQNLLIGTTTDGGQKLQVSGTGYFSGNLTVGSGSGTIRLAAGDGSKGQYTTDGTDTYLDYIGSIAIRSLPTYNTALALDSSQNATFAGKVRSNGTGFGVGADSDANTPVYALASVNGTFGALIKNSNAGSSAFAGITVEADSGQAGFRQYSTAHSVWAGKTLLASPSGGTGLVLLTNGSGDNVDIYTNGTLAATFDTSQNATFAGFVGIKDGMTAPSATSGTAKIYVDTADGDLKVIFGDGTIKTIATDT